MQRAAPVPPAAKVTAPEPKPEPSPPPAAKPQQAAEPREEGVAVTMPHQDMIVEEVQVVRWLKDVGGSVAAGEGLVEIETEKAVVEIETPAAGVLAEILAPAGSTVPLGGRLGTIRPPAGKTTRRRGKSV